MANGKFTAKKIAAAALLTALSLITFLLENLLPPMILPGAKPGLANIFSLAALIMYGPAEAFIIVCIRTLLGAIICGNVSALLYSFTGGVVSMAVSAALMYLVYPKISVMSVSIAAAVAHNITQNAVFVLVSSTPLMWGYLPYLGLLGILSGAIVGGITMLIFRAVPKSAFTKLLGNDKGITG